jgi:adenylate cyclase class 2
MQTEIEAKFLNVNHDEIREKLRELGGVCEQPMRLMRRVVFHSDDMEARRAFVRVRDEGHRVTMTYKQFDADTIDGAKEYEIEVSDFDTAIALLDAAGIAHDTFQESRRENWRLDDVEIMLDEWPWLAPYMEIEGLSEERVKSVAERLGFAWEDAVFGGVANAYAVQYPHIGEAGVQEINKNWPVIKLNDPLPKLLKDPLGVV